MAQQAYQTARAGMRTSALLVRGDMSVDLRFAGPRKVRQSKGESQKDKTGCQALRRVWDPYLHGTPPLAPSIMVGKKEQWEKRKAR